MQELDVESGQPGKIPGIGEILRVAGLRRRVGAVYSGMINIVRNFAERLGNLQTGQLFGEPEKWRPADDVLQHTAQGIETLIRLGDTVGLQAARA